MAAPATTLELSAWYQASGDGRSTNPSLLDTRLVLPALVAHGGLDILPNRLRRVDSQVQEPVQ
jgi:hypothetical protein